MHTWLDAIPVTEMVVNNAVSDATGASPAHLALGHAPRMPVDLLDGMHRQDAAQ